MRNPADKAQVTNFRKYSPYIEDSTISQNVLRKVYGTLIEKYGTLLRKIIKMTTIGDKAQHQYT